MARGEAIQKANVDDPDNDEKMKMYHGGMGMMSDPVSGNPIPVGSSAENVRDDIEAMISEGEYVLPANVVKWHGLKHIMDMQSEAEMGLMGMYDTGLIQYAGEEEAEEPEEVLLKMVILIFTLWILKTELLKELLIIHQLIRHLHIHQMENELLLTQTEVVTSKFM